MLCRRAMRRMTTCVPFIHPVDLLFVAVGYRGASRGPGIRRFVAGREEPDR